MSKRTYDKSLGLIEIGLNSYTDNLELISLKAQNLYWQERYYEAIKSFNTLIDLGEVSGFILEKLSMSYAKTYEYEKAIDLRKKILQIHPFDATSLYVIGNYYYELKDYKLAEEYVMKSLYLMDKPLNEEYQTLGIIYNRQNKFKESIASFEKALKENPEDENAAFFMARAKEEYYADAQAKIRAYEGFFDKYPESPHVPFAKERIKVIKENEFMKGSKTVDTTKKD